MLRLLNTKISLSLFGMLEVKIRLDLFGDITSRTPKDWYLLWTVTIANVSQRFIRSLFRWWVRFFSTLPTSLLSLLREEFEMRLFGLFSRCLDWNLYGLQQSEMRLKVDCGKEAPRRFFFFAVSSLIVWRLASLSRFVLLFPKFQLQYKVKLWSSSFPVFHANFTDSFLLIILNFKFSSFELN